MDLEALAQLVSLGTLVSFYCTAAALLWRRHCDRTPASRRTTAVRLSCSIAFSLCECCQAVLPLVLPHACKRLHILDNCSVKDAPSQPMLGTEC